jgi:hypothetical protein
MQVFRVVRFLAEAGVVVGQETRQQFIAGANRADSAKPQFLDQAIPSCWHARRDPLPEIRSLAELDEFEHELKRVMREFDLCDSRANRDIQYRREHLIEGEEHSDEEGYRRSTSLSEAEFSDDKIRSMFQGLLGR